MGWGGVYGLVILFLCVCESEQCWECEHCIRSRCDKLTSRTVTAFKGTYYPMPRVGHCSLRSRLYGYTHAQTVFTLSIEINRAKHAQSIIIIKHKCMLMCNHKTVLNTILCLWNSTVVGPRFQTRRTIDQYSV